jgi:predicted dithiol-disulfide oxidoreductase (DUF899 family)
MTEHAVVDQAEWTAARRQLLAKEKELTRLRDELAAMRRALPWERVEKPYVFEGPNGRESLAELFAGRSQLIIYHFMFAPDWDVGCKHCSFWADTFNPVVPHLAQRDVTLVAVSRAPVAKLQPFERRMGWTFKWVSSEGTDFSFDYGVSFTAAELAKGDVTYNYGRTTTKMPDRHGVSVFCKEPTGTVFHTYSCYARGVDALNAAYQYLDLVPKGRAEDELPYPMSWVKLRDLY